MNHAELRAVLFTDMTNEAYHADKGSISSSGLKQILLSPGHLRHYLDQPHVETTPLRVGTAIHTALLEPEKFGDEYVISPEFNRRTNQGKADEAAFLAEAKANNRKVVNERELAMLHGIRDSVSRHRMATHLLSVGKAEQSVFWTDAEYASGERILRRRWKCALSPQAASGVAIDLRCGWPVGSVAV